jgi:uncharacterized protein YbbK (DUF523 family)
MLVSSCLLGAGCAYDGHSRKNPRVLEFCSGKKFTPVCPEVLGGLGCPRETHEILGGSGSDVLKGKARVVSFSGVDRTDLFLKGAEEVLKIARNSGCSTAVFKENSPSCGVKRVYSGNFDSTKVPGHGVTSAILENAGIRVVSYADIQFS